MKNIFFKIGFGMIIIISVILSMIINNIIFKDFTIGSMIMGIFYGDFVTLLSFVGIFFLIVFLKLGISFFLLKGKVKLSEIFSINKDNLATSDFSKEKDFKGITGADGLIIGKKFRLSEKKSFEHTVCVGPTGSGKSVSFFIPNLISLPNHASVVVSDPKGELFEKTAQHALDQGKKVLVFSPFKNETMKYNPLTLCRDVSEVRELAQVLLANGNASIESITGTKAGGSEWTNMATPLLSAFLLLVKRLDPPNNTIAKALELIIENDLDTLKMLVEDTDEDVEKQFNIFLQSSESEKTASSIKTVLATGLQMFTDPLIQNITSLNEINPKMLRKEPTHLYVCVPEHKSSFMAPLMSPFYSQLLNHLIEDGSGSPVYFLLDEFANIGLIPNIDVIAATCRSRNMSLSLGIQSVNQLKQRYNEASISLLDNLKTKFFFPGLSFESAEYASKMIGFKEINTTSTSYGAKKDVSHSVSKQKRELLTPDEIRRLEDETLLIVSDNRNPFKDLQYRYYKDKKMVELASKELDINEYVVRQRKIANGNEDNNENDKYEDF